MYAAGWLQATETGGDLDMRCIVEGVDVPAVARNAVTVTKSGDNLATVDWGFAACASASGQVFAQTVKSPATWYFPENIPDVSAGTTKAWIGGS